MTIAWSDELVNDICDHLSTGKSLLDVARLKGYPSADSMYRQMARDEDFAARCARAREAGQDFQADEIVRMADEATEENVQITKVRISARQWRAAKLAPRRYGDSLKLSDADGNRLTLTDEQLDAKIAALTAQVGVGREA